MKLLYFICLLTALTSFGQSEKIAHAKALADKGEFKKAIKVMDELIANNPHPISYYKDKVTYQVGLKDFKGIIETLTEGIRVLPDSAVLYSTRGVFFDAVGLYNEALADFRMEFAKAQSKNEKARALSNIGGTQSKIRDFEGAYKSLKEAIELNPSDINALNNIAAVCDKVNRPDETFIYLDRVVKLNPNVAVAYVNIGFKYQKLGQHEKAIGYFNKAIELEPEEALAYSNRSFSKLKLQDLEGAMQDINLSIALRSMNSYAYKIRALVVIEKGNQSSACKDLETALELGYTEQYGNEVVELIGKHCKK
jgi:tetratricopeptide (TPR) repeat protein